MTESLAFRSLVRRRWTVALGLTAVMLAAYFSFILILALAKDWLAWELTPSTPVGIPVGVGLILFAWLLTGIYIGWANLAYDKQVQTLRGQMGAKED